MKTPLLPFAALAAASAFAAETPIILDELGARNLGIQTVEADYIDFDETLFAIGRIESIPQRRAGLASRVAGHLIELNAYEGDRAQAGQALARVESLQPGNPPPRIDLRAPIDGLVMRSHTHLGAAVSPESELLEIIDLAEVHAVARLPEDQAGRLEPGAKARIAAPAAPGRAYEGELVRFGVDANAASGTIDALFKIDNPDYRLRPGMRAEFSIILDTQPETLAVPREAVQSEGASRFVFVRDYDLPNAFIKAPVQTGAQNDEYVAILAGIFPGDEVVTRGSYALRFAGGGSISLKEALDAAHGHEHNEDGSEIEPGQRSHDPARDRDEAPRACGQAVVLLSILCGLLLALLILSLTLRGRKEHP